MAASDYNRGDMNIDAQQGMWDGFMKGSTWGALITLLAVGYMTFTLSLGMNFLVALVLMAGAGIGIGLFMGMGGAWIATVIGLSALALFVQLLVWLGSLMV